MDKPSILAFGAAAVASAALTSATFAEAALTARIPVTTCVPSGNNTASIYITGQALEHNDSSFTAYVCGFDAVNFYDATSLNVVMKPSASNHTDSTNACVQSSTSATMFCGNWVSTTGTAYQNLHPALTYWTSAYASYRPFIQIILGAQDILQSVGTL